MVRAMRIALIEDNAVLADAIARVLSDHGHSVDCFVDGVSADHHLQHEGCDLAIIDINLPELSGLDLLRRMRQRREAAPVLLLTARTDTADRVSGLDAGADDYLVKPFAMAELMARVRALMRRRPDLAAAKEWLGPLEFDRSARRLYGPAGEIVLPRKELALFECLVDRRGRIVSPEDILDHIYGVGSDSEAGVVQTYVSRLRKRLDPYGVAIRTARGLGYLLDAGSE